MNRVCCVALVCLTLMMGGMAHAGDDTDVMMDRIYSLALDDYQGMFAMTGEVDGAYSDALAYALSNGFFANPEGFINALGKADAARQDTVISLIAYDTHLRNAYATHPFLILEDELSIASSKPGVDTDAVQRFLDGITEYWQLNGPDASN